MDNLLVILMSLQIGLSFGRIALLQPLIEFVVLSFILLRYRSDYKKIAVKIIGLLCIVIGISVVAFYVIPNGVVSTFIERFTYMFTEVDSSQTISSTVEAMGNWRAYEIQAAKEQWFNSNVFVQMFGAGMGKGIYIAYIPSNWVETVINNEIPLLHNGFYTLLIKGGLFAVISLLIMFAGSVVKGLKIIKNNGENQLEGFILIGIVFAGFANTYVVRGPVQQGAFLVWGLLIGYLSNVTKGPIGYDTKNRVTIE